MEAKTSKLSETKIQNFGILEIILTASKALINKWSYYRCSTVFEYMSKQ